MAGKDYGEFISGGGTLTISVKEVLDEKAANKVDKQVKAQKKELAEPIDIKIRYDDELQNLENLRKAAKQTYKEMQDALSLEDGAEKIAKLSDKYSMLNKQVTESESKVRSLEKELQGVEKHLLKFPDGTLLDEKDTKAVRKYCNEMKKQMKETYKEAEATQDAIGLVFNIKNKKMENLVGKFNSETKAANALLKVMTDAANVHTQKGREAALRSLDEVNYDRIIEQNAEAEKAELAKQQSELEQAWEDYTSSALGAKALKKVPNNVRALMIKAAKEYNMTLKEVLDILDEAWLRGITTKDKKYSSNYWTKYIKWLNDEAKNIEHLSEAKVGDLNVDSLFDADTQPSTYTDENIKAIQQEVRAYDELIEAKRKAYGIEPEVEKEVPGFNKLLKVAQTVKKETKTAAKTVKDSVQSVEGAIAQVDSKKNWTVVDHFNNATESAKKLAEQIFALNDAIKDIEKDVSSGFISGINGKNPSEDHAKIVVDAFNRIKDVKQQIESIPLVRTEEEKKKLFLLQREYKKLSGTIASAKVADYVSSDYAKQYGLSQKDAQFFMDIANPKDEFGLSVLDDIQEYSRSVRVEITNLGMQLKNIDPDLHESMKKTGIANARQQILASTQTQATTEKDLAKATESVTSADKNQTKALKQKAEAAREVAQAREEEAVATEKLAKAQEKISKQPASAKQTKVYTQEELEIVKKENGELKDRLELLSDIAGKYGATIDRSERKEYAKLFRKDVENNLTDEEREQFKELSDVVEEADDKLDKFGDTYDKIKLKLANGRRIQIMPNDGGLRKLNDIANGFQYGTYDGSDIVEVQFERTLWMQKQMPEVIEEQTVAAQKLANEEQKLLELEREKNAAYDKQQPLISQYDALGDEINELSDEYKTLLSYMYEWRKVATETLSFPDTNASSLRKKVLACVKNVSEETAKVIGDSFANGLKNGFKGVKTQEILAMLRPIVNEIKTGEFNFFGTPITDAFNLVDSIDLRNFNISDIEEARDEIIGLPFMFEDLFNILTKIADKRKEQLEIERQISDVQFEIFDVQSRETSYKNSLISPEELTRIETARKEELALASARKEAQKQAEKEKLYNSPELMRNRLMELDAIDPEDIFGKTSGDVVLNEYDDILKRLTATCTNLGEVFRTLHGILMENPTSDLRQYATRFSAGVAIESFLDAPFNGEDVDGLLDKLISVDGLGIRADESLCQLIAQKIIGDSQVIADRKAALEKQLEEVDVLIGNYEAQMSNRETFLHENGFFENNSRLDAEDDEIYRAISVEVDKLLAVKYEIVRSLDDIKNATVQLTPFEGDSINTFVNELLGDLSKPIELPVAVVFDVDKQIKSENADNNLESQVKVIEEAYEDARSEVERLSNELSEANKELEKMQKNADLFGYTMEMSAREAGRVTSVLSKPSDKKYPNYSRQQYVVDMLKAGHAVTKSASGEYGFDRSDISDGVYNSITATEYKFAQYLTQKITEMNVGWEKGLEILSSLNGQLDEAGNKVANIESRLSETMLGKETAYEKMSYAHSGIIGDEAIAEYNSKHGIENQFPVEIPVIPSIEPGAIKEEIIENVDDKPVEVPVTPVVQKTVEEKALRNFRMAVEGRLHRTHPYETEGMQKRATSDINQLNGYKQKLEELYKQGKITQEQMQEIESQYDKTIQHMIELGANNIEILSSVFVVPEVMQEAVVEEQKLEAAVENVNQDLEKQVGLANDIAEAILKDNSEKTKSKKKNAKKDTNSETIGGLIGNLVGDEEDDVVPIIQKKVDDALKDIQTARNAKNLMVDLSEVFSQEDLTIKVGEIVKKAFGSDLSVGSVDINKSIATINLYNKELGVVTQQVWQLKEAQEGASEAQLEFVSADKLRLNFEQAEKYAAAQQKKIDQSNKWIIGEQKKLDNLTRSYQYSDKKINGSAALTTEDGASLTHDAEKKIDGLAAHIKNRLASLVGGDITEGAKNAILNDLRILENEIKINQYEKYANSDMTPTEIGEAKKQFEYELKALEQKAKKNNVFEAMKPSLDSLTQKLQDKTVEGYVKDGTDVGGFVNSLRTVRKELNAAISNEGLVKKQNADFEHTKSLLDQIYDSKKRLEKLQFTQAPGSSDILAEERHLGDLEAKYKASHDLITDQEKRIELAAREAKLNTELTKVREELSQKAIDDAKKIEDSDALKNSKEEQNNIQKAITLQNQLYEAKKKKAALKASGDTESSDYLKAQRVVDELQEQYDLTQKLITSKNSLASLQDREAKLEKELSAVIKEKEQARSDKDSTQAEAERTKQIKDSYQEILDTVNKINSIDTEIISLKKKNGSGIYSGLIDQLQAEKNELISKVHEIGAQVADEIGESVQGKDTYSVDSRFLSGDGVSDINAFLNDSRVQSALTVDEINKLTAAFSNSKKIGVEAVSEIANAFKQISEVNGKIGAAENINKDSIAYNNASITLQAYLSKLQEFGGIGNAINWTGDQYNEIQKLANECLKYSNVLDQAIDKEKAYFSGKSQYKKGMTIGTLMVRDNDGLSDAERKVQSIQDKLQEIARNYSGDSSPIFTGFTQGADGISKLDFSVFDKATGSLRKFKLEMGSVTDNLSVTETTINKTTSDFESASKQWESIASLIQKVTDGSELGKDNNSFKQLKDIFDQLTAVLTDPSGDTSKLKQILSDAKLSTKEVEKLVQALQTVNNIENGNGENKSLNKAINQMTSSAELLSRLNGMDLGDGNFSVAKLQDIVSKLKSELTTNGGQNVGLLSQLTKDARLASSEIEKLYKQHIKVQDLIELNPDSEIGKINPNANVERQMIDMLKGVNNQSNVANVSFGKFNEKLNELPYSVTYADGTVKSFTASMSALTGQVVQQQSGISKNASMWEKFGSSLSKTTKQFTNAFMGASVAYKAISEFKKGYQYVKNIDLALTELKKVTDETEKSYQNFLQTASKTASVIGSTVTDFTNATADFARLGYTMNESASMAEAAIVYKNVGEGIDDISVATESIISTMKAFGMESDSTMSIVDRFNEVANNFAISSVGIGDAMTRSASALNEAGNSIDESIALITAAMKIGCSYRNI